MPSAVSENRFGEDGPLLPVGDLNEEGEYIGGGVKSSGKLETGAKVVIFSFCQLLLRVVTNSK